MRYAKNNLNFSVADSEAVLPKPEPLSKGIRSRAYVNSIIRKKIDDLDIFTYILIHQFQTLYSQLCVCLPVIINRLLKEVKSTWHTLVVEIERM